MKINPWFEDQPVVQQHPPVPFNNRAGALGQRPVCASVPMPHRHLASTVTAALLPPSSSSTSTSLGRQDEGSDPARVTEGSATPTPASSRLPQRTWWAPVSPQPLRLWGGLAGSNGRMKTSTPSQGLSQSWPQEMPKLSLQTLETKRVPAKPLEAKRQQEERIVHQGSAAELESIPPPGAAAL